MWFGNDITKCPGEIITSEYRIECSCKDKCYRYTVKPDKYQSYSNFPSLLENGKKCEYFISNEE